MDKNRGFTSVRLCSRKLAPQGRLEQEIIRYGIKITLELTDEQVAAWLAALRSIFPARDGGECSDAYELAEGEISLMSGDVLASSDCPNIDNTTILIIETHIHGSDQEEHVARAHHRHYTEVVEDMTDGILTDDGVFNDGFEEDIAYSDKEGDVLVAEDGRDLPMAMPSNVSIGG